MVERELKENDREVSYRSYHFNSVEDYREREKRGGEIDKGEFGLSMV